MRLVHVRVFEPPMRSSGRFYPETSEHATAVLERAVATAWGLGSKASGEVIDAQRSLLGAVIAAAASQWQAEVIVVPRRHRHPIGRLLLGSVADQILRRANCPVLVVRPQS